VAVDRPPELLLRAYRQWYGLDQMQAASTLADLGEAVDGSRPGVTNEMISRWECGASRPGPHYRRLLCALYQVSEAHLGLRRPLPGEIVVHPWDRLDDDHPAVAAWTMEGAVTSVRAALEADMRRRTFLAAAGAAVTRPAHDWLLAAPLGTAPHTTGASLPATVVDHLDGIAGQLRRMDDQLGGGGLQPVVRQHLTHVIDLIEHRRYSDALGRRLHTVAAELARLAGWTSFDAGVHGAAQRYFAAALHAAHVAGDRALGANILGFASCQAKDLGQITEAVHMADAAIAGYPGASPRVTAILHLRLAEAQANAHQHTPTRRAVDTAFNRLTDCPPPGGEPDWCYWITEAQAHAQAGYCYLTLHDWTAARTHLRTALDLQGPSFSREAALRKILLAVAYARQPHPDLDHAAALGAAAVTTLTGEVTSTRCAGHVSRLTAQLTPHRRNPAVRDFLDLATHVTDIRRMP
jgi:hypothetical protein